jgi:hypothetical protein
MAHHNFFRYCRESGYPLRNFFTALSTVVLNVAAGFSLRPHRRDACATNSFPLIEGYRT